MNEKILQITASSPEDLRVQLAQQLKEGGGDYDFIALSLNDPKLYVYPFTLPKMARKELIPKLIEEAVALTSLHVNNIELDYQVFGDKDTTSIEGVFVCIPRKHLEDYINICDAAGLIPIHLSSSLLTCVGQLFEKHKTEKGHFAVLDFTSDNRASVALFSDQRCAFLRQIKYENTGELRADIIQSLRSACAKSQVKTIEHIYIGNLTEEGKGLLDHIEAATHSQVIREEGQGAGETGRIGPGGYFSVNLMRNYSFALPRRRQFTLIARAVVGLLLLLVVINGIRFIAIQSKADKIRSSYQAADVQYARDLQKKVDALPHAN